MRQLRDDTHLILDGEVRVYRLSDVSTIERLMIAIEPIAFRSPSHSLTDTS